VSVILTGGKKVFHLDEFRAILGEMRLNKGVCLDRQFGAFAKECRCVYFAFRIFRLPILGPRPSFRHKFKLSVAVSTDMSDSRKRKMKRLEP
jgi:hypothetical protein